MPVRSHCLRLTLALFCVLSLAACNTTQLAYNQGDRVVAWRAASMLGLDRQQRGMLRDEIQTLRAWHRAAQLPEYRSDLQYLAAALDPAQPEISVDRKVAEYLVQRANAHMNELTACALPRGVHLLRQLSDEQLVAIREELQTSAQKRMDKVAEQDEAEWREELVDDMAQGLRPWIGRIDDDQRRRIAQWAQARQSTPRMWLEHREDWLPDAFELLSHRHEEDFTQRLFTYLEDFDARRPETLRQAAAADRELWMDLMLDLEASLSPEQRKRMLSRLDSYANDAQALSTHDEADMSALRCAEV